MKGKLTSNRYVNDGLELIFAFIVAFIFYQGLSFGMGTPTPIVSVVSDSMLPILHRGDLVLVGNGNDLRVNDIGIYQRTDSQFTIIHRIVEIQEDGYIFKGDNNPCVDTVPGNCNGDTLVVRQSQISGKVLFSVPLLGYPRLILFAFGI